MDPSSSSRFSTARAEASLSTEVDVVGGLEATRMVGAEGASTFGRTEYYSARCEEMKLSGGQFSDDVDLEIEFSKPHWSEVSRLEVAPQSAEEEELNRENRELLKQLNEEYPDLFRLDVGRGVVLGRMIAKGGQAEIYEVVGNPDILLKVFERGTSLRDLRRSWPLPVLKKDVRQCIWWAGMLKDGSFAFLMERFWGDLRKLIDQAMLEKNVDGIQGPPFPYKWKDYKRWTFYPDYFMLRIAVHMLDLHRKGISHRDLKASNILLQTGGGLGKFPFFRHSIGLVVADFECSIGVLGTGFWRAPEVFLAQEKRETMSNEQWMVADVYSYGMTCFEIVTGKIPFDGETPEFENTKANRQLVIEGTRPQLPSDLDDAVKDLITKCWESNPKLRPTFVEIVEMVESISKRQCEFRLFGNGDELPPQYRLATVQEADDFPIPLMKAMPQWEIANLENGFVDGYRYGLNTRLERRGDVAHKLARLHH